MTLDISLRWQQTDLSKAISALAMHGKLISAGTSAATIDRMSIKSPFIEDYGRWITTTAQQLRLDAQQVSIGIADLEQAISHGTPLILKFIDEHNKPYFLLIARQRGQRIEILTPDGNTHRIQRGELLASLKRELLASYADRFGASFQNIGLNEDETTRILEQLATDFQSAPRFTGWMLRLPPYAPFWQQIKRTGLHWRFGLAVGLHILQYGLFLVSWVIIGRALLGSEVAQGWIIAWVLLFATIVPLRLGVSWYQGTFMIGLGVLIKRRLLHGALGLDVDQNRKRGIGQQLGRVIESESLENLGVTGGFIVITSLIEIVLVGGVFLEGTGGVLHFAIYLATMGFTAIFAWLYYRQYRDWTAERREMTHDFVEQMTGNRTRVVQSTPQQWHQSEDTNLANYYRTSSRLDWLDSIFHTIPQAYLFVGLVGLAPTITTDNADIGGLAVALGALFLVGSSLRNITSGFSSLAQAIVAWGELKPLYDASVPSQIPGEPTYVMPSTESQNGAAPVLLTATGLTYRYDGASHDALIENDLIIASGERILLEGPSGSGKTTLVSVLNGLRLPTNGTLKLYNADIHKVGQSEWRRRIALATQFHENYIISETFAFNLLMGRSWPPSQQDMLDAENMARELGLGKLLDTMPAGMLQIIGETGWQLSHGERSRLFVARTLLQGGDVVVLDESLGALDPHTMQSVLDVVSRHARTLIVISHF